MIEDAKWFLRCQQSNQLKFQEHYLWNFPSLHQGLHFKVEFLKKVIHFVKLGKYFQDYFIHHLQWYWQFIECSFQHQYISINLLMWDEILLILHLRFQWCYSIDCKEVLLAILEAHQKWTCCKSKRSTCTRVNFYLPRIQFISLWWKFCCLYQII